jgi:hypothetical protein
MNEIYSNSEVKDKSLEIVSAYLGEYTPIDNFYYHLVYVLEGNTEKVVFLKTSSSDFKNVVPRLKLRDKLDKLSIRQNVNIEAYAYLITTHGFENFNYESFVKPLPGFESISIFTNGFLIWKNQIQILIMQALSYDEKEAIQWIKDYNKKTPAVRKAMHNQFYMGQSLFDIIQKYNPSPDKFFINAPLEQAELLRPKSFKWPNTSTDIYDRYMSLLKERDDLKKQIVEFSNNQNYGKQN